MMDKEDKPIKEKCKHCGEDIIYKPATIVPYYTDYMHVRTHRKKCDLKDTTEWAEPYEDSIS
jgi:hypothetical protein